VYHDLGNVNFSVKMPRPEFTRRTYADLVVRAMERKDVHGCTVTDRGDIVMVRAHEGFKVSGSAYKISKDIAYHHGTMLLGADLEQLRLALKVEGRMMLRDQGVDSVRANHVSNVPFPGENNDIKFKEFVQVVREEFEEMHGKHPFVELWEENVERIPEIQTNVAHLNVVCLTSKKLTNRAGIGSLAKRQSSQKNCSSTIKYIRVFHFLMSRVQR